LKTSLFRNINFIFKKIFSENKFEKNIFQNIENFFQNLFSESIFQNVFLLKGYFWNFIKIWGAESFCRKKNLGLPDPTHKLMYMAHDYIRHN